MQVGRSSYKDVGGGVGGRGGGGGRPTPSTPPPPGYGPEPNTSNKLDTLIPEAFVRWPI